MTFLRYDVHKNIAKNSYLTSNKIKGTYGYLTYQTDNGLMGTLAARELIPCKSFSIPSEDIHHQNNTSQMCAEKMITCKKLHRGGIQMIVRQGYKMDPPLANFS